MRVDGGYTPSFVVNVKLRFDEALQVARDQADLDAAARRGEPGVPKGEPTVSVKFDDIVAESYDQSGGVVRRRVAPGRRTSSEGGPLGFVQSQYRRAVRVGRARALSPDEAAAGDAATVSDFEIDDGAGARRGFMPLTYGGDGFTVVMNAVPHRGSAELPHPRQAPKFRLTFPYDALPIDPRLLRAAGVEIHLGCVSDQAFGDGQLGGQAGDGRSSSILATRMELLDPATGRPAVADSTLLFYGTVDDWEVEHSDSGSTATISGRGIVAILLDGKPPADVMTKIDLNRPIHRVVADILATVPTDARLALDVMTDADEWPNGVVPAPGSVEGFTNIRLTAKDGQPKAGGGGGDRVSYWDLITNLCNFVGAVPYLHGSTLWVRPGRSIFEILDNPGRSPFRSPRSAVPMARGLVPSAYRDLAVRRLVLGRNVERFRLKRQFGGTTVPVVKVYGFDDRATGKNRVVTGQWPPPDSPAAKSKTDGEVITISMGGIRDPNRLTQIARSVYEEQGRGEVGGEFGTSSLASFGGDNADPDLLRLRPLEPVEIVVDNSSGPTPIVHELSAQLSMTFDQEVDALADRLGDRDAARAIVSARRGTIVGVLDTYRVTAVRYEVDAQGGVRVTGDFQNYIVARHGEDRDAATGSGRVQGARVTNPGQNRRRQIRRAFKDAAANLEAFFTVTPEEAEEIERIRELARRKRLRDEARSDPAGRVGFKF